MTVHKADCINMISEVDADRLVEVSWDEEAKTSYSGTVQILAYDRQNLLADLVLFINSLNVSISAVSGKANKNQTCAISVTLEVDSRQALDRIIKQIGKRSDVIEVFRLSN